MIVSFSVSNFRSFSQEQTISLVASKRLSGRHQGHMVPIPDSTEMVLRTAVLYGANGAGKSNLFRALRYVREMALTALKRKSGTHRQVFCFGESGAFPSTFDLQFICQGKLYRFGFKVDDNRVMEEWLLQIVGNRERTLYERITDVSGEVRIEVPESEHPNKKLAALATVGGPANQTFLATIRATLEPTEIGEAIGSVLQWFDEELVLIGPEESLASMGQTFAADPELLAFAGAFLKNASTGVDHLTLSKHEVTDDEWRGLLSKGFPSELLDELRKEEGATVLQLGEGNELLIEAKDGGRFYRMRVEATHEHQVGKIVPLPLGEESDGTRRLLNLLPALHLSRSQSATYFIDEIDRSLHPMLVRNFLETFLQPCSSGARQIIVTTHESSLLDQEFLRRDEVWFAEKDEQAGTHLFSLMDFKVRNDLEIRKHYLQGRFGAVPFFGSLDGLLAEPGNLE